MANLKPRDAGPLSPEENEVVRRMRSLPVLLDDARMMTDLIVQITSPYPDGLPMEITETPALHWLANRLADRLEWMAGLPEAKA